MKEVINLWGFNLYVWGFFSALSFLWGGFVFFKKSAETHLEENHVLDIIVLSGFWGLLVGRIGFVVNNLMTFNKHWSRTLMISSYPGIDRWFFVLGVILALVYGSKKKKGKLFDYLDILALSFFASVSFFWSFWCLLYFDWRLLVMALLNLSLFLALWSLEKKYRFFDWYKGIKSSARTGFVFGFALSLVGICLLVEKILWNNLTVGFWLLGVIIAFVSGLVVVYSRSGRQLEDDFGIIKKWKKTKSK